MYNHDEDKSVFFIVEPNYMTPVWYSRSIEGLRDSASKQKYSVKQVFDISDIVDEIVSIIVIGTNRKWITEIISKARKRNIKTILIGAIPDNFGEDVSGTMYGGRYTIEEMVKYFVYYGRKRIALVDINPTSSNDVTKYDAFIQVTKQLRLDVSPRDVYFRDSGSLNSTDLFLSQIDRYDGVICSNDYTGAYLLAYAREHGIKVPEQLFVAGLGDIGLCRYTEPSLTSATRAYYEVGEQAFTIWKTLSRNPNVESVVSTMKSVLKPRGSTAFNPVPEAFNTEPVSQIHDSSRAQSFVICGRRDTRLIQECMSQCDDLDFRIIVGVLSGYSNEVLSEHIGASVGTINYRLKKIYRSAGITTKQELADLLRRYISVDTLSSEFSITD